MYEIGALESKSPRPPRLRRVQAGAGFLRPQQPRPVAAWRPCQPSDSGKGCVAGARRQEFQRPPRRSGKSGRPMIEARRPFGRPEWPRVRSGCRAQGLWAVLAVVVGGGLLLPRLTGATTVHDHAGQPVTRFPAEEGQLLHHRGRRPSAPAAAASAAMSLPAFTQQIEQEVDSGR